MPFLWFCKLAYQPVDLRTVLARVGCWALPPGGHKKIHNSWFFRRRPPSHSGCPGDRAVKRVCCCYCCVCVPYFVNMSITFHTITLKFILKYLRKEISIHSCYLCLKDRIKLSLIPEKYHVDATLPANSTNTLHSRLQNRSHRFDWFSFHGTFLTFHLKNTIYGTKQ